MEVTRRLRKDGLNTGHYDMRFVKPLDEELLDTIFERYPKIITVEDGCLMGGFGSAVIEYMVRKGYHIQVKMLGIPDRVVEHGQQEELHKECGFDVEGILNTALKMLETTTVSSRL